MWKQDITVAVVSCLIDEQFPQWADLPIEPVALDGWDNTTFRLGQDMSVRLPSHERYVPQIDKEHRWLPRLARHLPLPIPQPIAKGQPGCGFPAPWSIYRWLDGEPAALAGVADHDRLAEDLAAFLIALQAVSTEGAPPAGAHSFGRGGPVSVWDEQTRSTIQLLGDEIDDRGALAVWEAATAAPASGAAVWVHGDVCGSNILMANGRLCGIIDFGCSAVGDSACDLTPAWTLFEGSSMRRFVDALQCDEATWARARGWALWKALNSVAGRSASDPRRTGRRWGWRRDALGVANQVIADYRASARAATSTPGA
jgi:aminoglycoside phosphotransferase (APT) family kinase protein